MRRSQPSAGTSPPSIEPILLEGDRTLLAIINTALTLIGFGFTINEVFGDAAGRGTILRADFVGRILGLSLLTTGLVLLALGIRQHASLIEELTGESERIFRRVRRRSPQLHRHSGIYGIAVLLFLVGFLTLGAVLFGFVYSNLVHGR